MMNNNDGMSRSTGFLLSLLLLLIQGVIHTESSCFVTTSHHRKRAATRSSLLFDASSPILMPPPSQHLDYHSIVTESLGLTEEQYTKLDQLCSLVLDWNQKINLVSRQHAEPSVVWEKHILPSLAALACLREHTKDNGDSLTMKIIDVGTGGGFPGLPLAIACPESRFCLLDSVGKKLIAVQNMAEQLELTNVQTHHGRAEAYTGLLEQNGSHSLFDVATSRSVSALPNVCTWMHHLLEPKTGELLYWIGDSETEVAKDASLNDIVRVDAVVPGLKSDKSIWTLRQAQVSAIAKKSGIKMERNWQSKQPDATTSATASWSEKKGNRISPSKGAWKRKDPSAPKDRGYEGFQRYNSLEN